MDLLENGDSIIIINMFQFVLNLNMDVVLMVNLLELIKMDQNALHMLKMPLKLTIVLDPNLVVVQMELFLNKIILDLIVKLNYVLLLNLY